MSETELTSALVILFAAIFTNNIVLTNFLGLCSFLSVSRQIKSSVGLGAAVTFVTTFTAAINWLIYHHLLVPLDLVYLRFVIFIVIIAGFVQFAEIVIERFAPALYHALGIFLPLITVNCAVLGISLFMVIREYGLLETVGFGLGGGLGFLVGIVLLAALRWRIRRSKVPEALQGAGIAVILTGIMALAFVGFSGMMTIN
jgi:Na+-transporting NADH:ubiquinone oxidoreductase subunit E